MLTKMKTVKFFLSSWILLDPCLVYSYIKGFYFENNTNTHKKKKKKKNNKKRLRVRPSVSQLAPL